MRYKTRANIMLTSPFLPKPILAVEKKGVLKKVINRDRFSNALRYKYKGAPLSRLKELGWLTVINLEEVRRQEEINVLFKQRCELLFSNTPISEARKKIVKEREEELEALMEQLERVKQIFREKLGNV